MDLRFRLIDGNDYGQTGNINSTRKTYVYIESLFNILCDNNDIKYNEKKKKKEKNKIKNTKKGKLAMLTIEENETTFRVNKKSS